MELNLKDLVEKSSSIEKDIERNMKFSFKGSRNQIILSLIIGFGYMSLVFINMYTTRLLFYQFSMDITKQEEYKRVTWAINLLPIIGAIFGGIASHYLGRRCGILLTVTIFIGAIFITPFFMNENNTLICVIIERAFYLLAIGTFYVIATIYISETLHPRIRDQMGLVAVLFKLLGTLTFDLTRTNPRVLLALGIFQSFMFVVLLLWVGRESPYWYVSKWRKDDAKATFLWLNRDRTENETDEKINEIFRLNRDDKKSYFSHVCHKKALTPLTIICLLIFYQQFTGESTIRKQTPEILKPVDWTSIFWVIVALIFSFCSILLVPIVKKKGLLLISGFVIVISLIIKSVFTYIDNEDENDEYYNTTVIWIKVSYIMFNVGYAIGFMFIPWLLMGQLLPYKIKEFSAVISWSFYWLCRFGISQFFHYAFDTNHIPYAYGIFAFITLFSMIFVNWYLPETHMKSLEEIESHYSYADIEEKAIDEESEH